MCISLSFYILCKTTVTVISRIVQDRKRIARCPHSRKRLPAPLQSFPQKNRSQSRGQHNEDFSRSFAILTVVPPSSRFLGTIDRYDYRGARGRLAVESRTTRNNAGTPELRDDYRGWSANVLIEPVLAFSDRPKCVYARYFMHCARYVTMTRNFHNTDVFFKYSRS